MIYFVEKGASQRASKVIYDRANSSIALAKREDFNWKEAMNRLATLPRQAEWEAFVARFQGCSAEARSDEKWQMMERMFHLY